MPDKPVNNRPQINIRLDREPHLLDQIKQTAGDRQITVSEFLINAIKSALGRPQTQEPSPPPIDEAFLAEIDKLIDAKLDERLGELSGGC